MRLSWTPFPLPLPFALSLDFGHPLLIIFVVLVGSVFAMPYQSSERWWFGFGEGAMRSLPL
jgi:hypothetical protein